MTGGVTNKHFACYEPGEDGALQSSPGDVTCFFALAYSSADLTLLAVGLAHPQVAVGVPVSRTSPWPIPEAVRNHDALREYFRPRPFEHLFPVETRDVPQGAGVRS